LSSKIVASDGAVGDSFGYSIAVSGNMVVVGAKFDDFGSKADQGSASVFDCSSFPCVEKAKLTATADAQGYFGRSVAISGSLVVAGAPFHTVGSIYQQGAAFVFNCSSFPCTQSTMLTVSDGKSRNQFGYSVAISGSLVVVGTPGGSVIRGDQGIAYVFDCSSFPCTQKAKLTSRDADAGDFFGFSVAISGSLVAIGAPNDDFGTTNLGSAYVFDCSSFPCTQSAKLIAIDGATEDQFGWSVAISGKLVVAGTYYDSIGSKSAQGSAYVFNCSSFPCTQSTKLTASDGDQGDYFGWLVAISGSLVAIGAPYADFGPQTNQGSVYIFDCFSFPCIQSAKLTASDGTSYDNFGYSVAISGSLLVAGATGDDIGSNSDQGSASVFKLNTGFSRPTLFFFSLSIHYFSLDRLSSWRLFSPSSIFRSFPLPSRCVWACLMASDPSRPDCLWNMPLGVDQFFQRTPHQDLPCSRLWFQPSAFKPLRS
jgi:hypothetical protein